MSNSVLDVVLEIHRLLSEQTTTLTTVSELARGTAVWVCGQWTFLVLACTALIALVLRLYLKNTSIMICNV